MLKSTLSKWGQAIRTALAFIVLCMVLLYYSFELGTYFFSEGYKYKCSKDLQTSRLPEETHWLRTAEYSSLATRTALTNTPTR